MLTMCLIGAVFMIAINAWSRAPRESVPKTLDLTPMTRRHK